ncbi:M24 family metallopeptidase [Acinetobacter sp. VNK23]|uniref:M24 family metallopeptidase n=1 Tax=Acinetobacter thutiue TaxID=2998078 RepID=UPI002575F3C5|nr:M24 family metallopeptidase [Acinetobacter thutiue]MDM1020302.1 M24 family metallopeptidase [Acinetobacter thutiue]
MPLGYTQIPQGKLDKIYRKFYRVASKYSGLVEKQATKDALNGFKVAQRLAYDATEHVAKQLKVGMTEKQAADLLENYLKQHGTERYLHRAFAWFGNHSRFDEYEKYDDFHPSDRVLKDGDVVILDVSPVVNGYIGDVGYAVSIGENPELEKARSFQLKLRQIIPELFASSMTSAEIWQEINRLITEAGYDTVHSKYPHCVLGHRVFRVKPKQGKHLRIGWGGFGWFSLETNLKFLSMGPSAALGPEHQGNKLGLWAIEPHFGWQGAGCKFEEILVVEPDRVYWLDDDVPHVKQSKGTFQIKKFHE